jgi:uncharacterized protein YndB with AHSA1/START domain
MSDTATTTSTPTIVHDTFVLERTYPHPAERVYAAWSSLDAKAAWFGGNGPAAVAEGRYTMDFRVGGSEHLEMAMGDTPVEFDVRYMDIVPSQRIVYAYDMHIGGARISASLATIEFFAQGDATRMVVTENGAYLDGLDDPRMREHGTGELLDALGRSLDG